MNISPVNENCSISEAAQAKRNNEAGDDDSLCEIRRTSSSDITNLPEDFLKIIFNRLESRDDRLSFGLTCRQWLHIQNNNWKSLWYLDRNEEYPTYKENFSVLVCKLLQRFPHIKSLSLRWLPKITDFVVLQPPFSASKLQNLCLDNHYDYSDTELSLMFSSLPRLTYVSLAYSGTTDRGLEALAKNCSSLKSVDLSCCHITDSGIAFLLQSCRELRTLCIYSCRKITGIGFVRCPKTLIDVDARKCELSPKGIEAIVSGGGLKRLALSARHEMPRVDQGLRRTR